jgi:hypothetical protein
MLPASLGEPLERHLRVVRRLHARDLQQGFGRVSLPDALATKCPHAATDWRMAVSVSSWANLPRWAVGSSLAVSPA